MQVDEQFSYVQEFAAEPQSQKHHSIIIEDAGESEFSNIELSRGSYQPNVVFNYSQQPETIPDEFDIRNEFTVYLEQENEKLQSDLLASGREISNLR